jgi:hypothetical protein
VRLQTAGFACKYGLLADLDSCLKRRTRLLHVKHCAHGQHGHQNQRLSTARRRSRAATVTVPLLIASAPATPTLPQARDSATGHSDCRGKHSAQRSGINEEGVNVHEEGVTAAAALVHMQVAGNIKEQD